MANDVEAGLKAFQAGDAKEAYARLMAAARTIVLDDNASLVLAYAARAVGDFETGLSAVDKIIEKNPAHPDGLLIKADCFKAKGEARVANGFYQAFLRAVQAMQPPPQRLHQDIARAQQELQNAHKHYQEFLVEKVRAAGLSDDSGRSRIGQAVDIMLGKKTIYPQSPSKFFFPELPHIQFYDHRDFSWSEGVIEQADVIREELAALVSANAVFDPYVKHHANVPKLSEMGRQLIGKTDWSAYHLWQDGEAKADHMAHCPKTLEILKAAPIPKIPTVSPSVLFSKLDATSDIPPHSGICNTRLICHLPLINPPGCWLRVGNQVREWIDGEMLIFDDSIEHEAKNPTGENRTVLIFDVWRPELTEEERALVEVIFGAVASY